VVFAGVVPAVTSRRWLKEPLVHFLLAGFALFVATAWWEGPTEEGRTIRIGREDLLTYLQGRAQVYDAKTFVAMLEAMPAAERQALIRDAALQEALYREGEAVALAQADPLIRQRVVQQMRLLVMEDAAVDVQVGDEELTAYYRDHRQDYRAPAQVDFTHVFFSEAEGAAKAQAAAQAKLKRLRQDRVPFENAGLHGDRFLYQLNYADAGQDLVASHFGEDFARRVFALEPGAWQGPIRSEHGWHLAMLRGRSEAQAPALSAIRRQVREDALADKRTRLAQAALERMMARYEVVLEPDLRP
jgi:parvulin-like peptidyl-prolyl isomerase